MLYTPSVAAIGATLSDISSVSSFLLVTVSQLGYLIRHPSNTLYMFITMTENVGMFEHTPSPLSSLLGV